jgi:predicted metal-dependent TIM-barrel fold hydrolase
LNTIKNEKLDISTSCLHAYKMIVRHFHKNILQKLYDKKATLGLQSQTSNLNANDIADVMDNLSLKIYSGVFIYTLKSSFQSRF